MMDVLGYFAKNLLEKHEKERAEMTKSEELMKKYHLRPPRGRVRYRKFGAPVVDYKRVTEKVNSSVAEHISRLAKKRHEDAIKSLSNYKAIPTYGFRTKFDTDKFWQNFHKTQSFKGQDYQAVAVLPPPADVPSKITTKSSNISGKIKLSKKKKAMKRDRGKTDLKEVEESITECLSEDLSSRVNAESAGNLKNNYPKMSVMRQVRKFHQENAAAVKASEERQIDITVETLKMMSEKLTAPSTDDKADRINEQVEREMGDGEGEIVKSKGLKLKKVKKKKAKGDGSVLKRNLSEKKPKEIKKLRKDPAKSGDKKRKGKKEDAAEIQNDIIIEEE